jgi:hypothetical protein
MIRLKRGQIYWTFVLDRPGFTTKETSSFFYNSRGQLERQQTHGKAATLFLYYELGNQIATGLDIDSNLQLEEGSTDQLAASEISYVQESGQWWQQSLQWTYGTAGSATAILTGSQSQQLTGLGAGVVSRVVTTDIHGNQSINWVTIDPGAKTRTSFTDVFDSTTIGSGLEK